MAPERHFHDTTAVPDGKPAGTFTIRWERVSVHTRYPCIVCGGDTDKQDIYAVAYYTHHDGPPIEAGMVCDRCVEAGEPVRAERLLRRAAKAEALAADCRQAAGAPWTFPTWAQYRELEEQVHRDYVGITEADSEFGRRIARIRELARALGHEPTYHAAYELARVFPVDDPPAEVYGPAHRAMPAGVSRATCFPDCAACAALR